MTTTDEEFERLRVQAYRDERTDRANRTIRAHIPVRYRDAQLEHQDVIGWVQSFTEGDTAGLLLTGPTGVGKTYQAYAAFAECIRSLGGGWVMAGSVPTLLDKCRPGREPQVQYDYGEWQKQDVPGDMIGAKLLLLDDLGAEKPSDWTGEVLYRVIDERYMNLRPTIVVSNVPPRELAATIGDRLASRLTEMCRTVVMKGDDRRRQR